MSERQARKPGAQHSCGEITVECRDPCPRNRRDARLHESDRRC
jgi:hypothetical protein